MRPLVSADDDPSGRNISRGIVCLDHEQRDGLKGFVTITGGKLMTYRLMAEIATDTVCRKLGVDKPCTTAVTPLPGSEEKSYEAVAQKVWEAPTTAQKAAAARMGTACQPASASANRQDDALICECEEVSVGEINAAIDRMDVSTLTDLRRRTRVGMGTCQGEFCACRAAGLLAKATAASNGNAPTWRTSCRSAGRATSPSAGATPSAKRNTHNGFINTFWAYEIRYRYHRRRPGRTGGGHQPAAQRTEHSHSKHGPERPALLLRQFRVLEGAPALSDLFFRRPASACITRQACA